MGEIGQKFTSIIVSLLVVAIVTRLVLPSSKTPAVITSFFDGLTKSVTAAIGKE